MNTEFITHARMLKAMSDENRLRILVLLKEREYNASELLEEMEFGQSTLSHHMKILSEAGLVVGRRHGRCTHYSLLSEGMDLLMGYLSQLKISLNRAAGADAEAG